MPRYTYQCSKCEHEFDAIVVMHKRNELQKCENCGYVKAKRVFKGAPHYKQGGEGVNPDSWSDKFWEGAEKERLAHERKTQAEAKEKVVYGDKSVTTAVENRIVNTKRQGANNEAGAIARQYEKLTKKGKRNV